MSSDERINEIEGRLQRATPGPWEAYSTHVGCKAGYVCAAADPDGTLVPNDFRPATYDTKRLHEACANADLIAHAPGDLRYLLELVETLERDAARLDRLAHMVDDEGPWVTLCLIVGDDPATRGAKFRKAIDDHLAYVEKQGSPR